MNAAKPGISTSSLCHADASLSKSSRRQTLPLDSPPLDRYHNDHPSHQEHDKAHGDGEDKHCFQVVGLHRHDSISRLCLVSFLSFWSGIEKLTLAIKIAPPAIKQNAVMSSVGGRPGRTEVGGAR